MTEFDNLFIYTLRDIRTRIDQHDEYEILLIAGLLRKLFFDGTPLVDQVNKAYRTKLSFETTIAKPPSNPAPIFWSLQDGLSPETQSAGRPTHTLSRDQFFQTVVTVAQGRSHTVKDVVLYAAHVVGAVHAGSAKTDGEKMLQSADSTISAGGFAPSVRQLKAIGRVALKGLEPLEQAVMAARCPPDAQL